MNLKTILDIAEAGAREIILLKQRPLVPTWFIFSKDKMPPKVLSTPWGNEVEKRLAETFIRLELHKHKAAAYGFITEAWLARPQAKDYQEGVPASQQSGREEVLVALASDGKEKLIRTWKIVRDYHEQATQLQDYCLDQGSFVSWLGDLLDNK